MGKGAGPTSGPFGYHAALMELDEQPRAFRRHWDEIHDADANEFVFARLGGGELKDVFLEDT